MLGSKSIGFETPILHLLYRKKRFRLPADIWILRTRTHYLGKPTTFTAFNLRVKLGPPPPNPRVT